MTPCQMNLNKQMTRPITLSRVIFGYFLRFFAVLNCAAADLKSKLIKLFDPLVNPLRRPAFSQREQNIFSLPSTTSHLSHGNLSLHSDRYALHFGFFSGGGGAVWLWTSEASGVPDSVSSFASGLWKKLLRLVCLGLAIFETSLNSSWFRSIL